MDDRRIHAKGPAPTRLSPGSPIGTEIIEVVRYDRAGSWYVEGPIIGRVRVTLAEAVEAAREIKVRGGDVFLGRSGGGAFDRKWAAI